MAQYIAGQGQTPQGQNPIGQNPTAQTKPLQQAQGTVQTRDAGGRVVPAQNQQVTGQQQPVTPGGAAGGTPKGKPGGQYPQGGGKPGMQSYGAGGTYGGDTFGGFNPQGGYWGWNPRNVVGISPGEQAASGMAFGLPDIGSGNYNQAIQGWQQLQSGNLNPLMQQYMSQAGQLGQLPGSAEEAMNLYRQARGVGARQVTGAGLTDDPAFQAAQQAYETSIMPLIQNQAAMAGLGNSTALTNALGSAQAQYLLPTVQDTLARQERGIDRELQALMGGAGGLMSGAGMEQQGRMAGVNALGQGGQMSNQNLMAGTQGLFNMGNQEQMNQLNAINALMQTGGNARGISQAQQDAQYNEWIRQMTGFENSMFSPLGMTPGFMGARTIQQKK